MLSATITMASLAAVPASASAQGTSGGWQVSVQSEHHLDGAPLSLLDSDALWQTIRPRPGANLAYVIDEVDAGRRVDDWTVSLVARERGEVIANRDALAVGRVVDSGDDPATSRHWTVSAQAFGFVGAGLAVERQWQPADQWRLRTGVQVLALTRVIDRRITGWGSYDAAAGTYSADLHSWQADDHLRFPFQRGHASTGQAFLMDGELAWHAASADGGDDIRVALRWKDVGLLQWTGLPQQQETLSNQLTQRDANGFVVYQPLIQGRDIQTRWRRWSVPLSELELDEPVMDAGHWIVASRYLPGAGLLPRIGARQSASDWHFEEDWHVHERRAAVAVGFAGLRLSGGADLHASHRSLSWGIAWRSDGAAAR